jgi:hypothetical protein
LIDGLHSEAARTKMQLILAHMLERELVRRFAKMIFSDRIFNGHGHFPIVSHSQGSQNRYFPTHEEWLC